MNLFDILFMQKTGKIKPDADLFDILFAKVTGAIERLVTIVGNPLSFLAKKAQTAKSTKVTLSPVQDLHGYSNPWPAGGGKNKFDKSIVSFKETGYILNDNGERISSLASGYTYPMAGFEPNTRYVLSGYLTDYGSGAVQTANGYRVYYYDDNDTFLGRSDNLEPSRGYKLSFLTPSNCTKLAIQCQFTGDYPNWNTVQIEEGSTATSYAPYSNICPISGRTQVTVNGCGKNLVKTKELIFARPSTTTSATTSLRTFTENSYGYGLASNNYYYPNYIDSISYDDGIFKFTSLNTGYGIFIPTEKLQNGVTYTANADSSNCELRIAFYQNDGTFISSTTQSSLVCTFTVPQKAKYSVLIFKPTVTNQEITVKNIQIELGSIATDYEPYAESNDVTITFPALGHNIWDEEWQVGIINSGTGQYSSSGNRVVSKNFIPVKPSTEYAKTSNVAWTYFYDSQYNLISYISSSTFTTPSNCAFMKFYTLEGYGSTYNNDISINYPSTFTTYEPYTNTCYSGNLDLTSGVLTVNKVVATFVGDNTVTWFYSESGANRRVYTSYLGDIEKKTKSSSDMLANYLKYDASGNYPNAWSSFISNVYVLIIGVDESISSVDDWKDYLSANNLQVCYELETPRTIQLTPKQIQILKGQNTIWIEDEGATIALTYKN